MQHSAADRVLLARVPWFAQPPRRLCGGSAPPANKYLASSANKHLDGQQVDGAIEPQQQIHRPFELPFTYTSAWAY